VADIGKGRHVHNRPDACTTRGRHLVHGSYRYGEPAQPAPMKARPHRATIIRGGVWLLSDLALNKSGRLAIVRRLGLDYAAVQIVVPARPRGPDPDQPLILGGRATASRPSALPLLRSAAVAPVGNHLFRQSTPIAPRPLRRLQPR